MTTGTFWAISWFFPCFVQRIIRNKYQLLWCMYLLVACSLFCRGHWEKCAEHATTILPNFGIIITVLLQKKLDMISNTDDNRWYIHTANILTLMSINIVSRFKNKKVDRHWAKEVGIQMYDYTFRTFKFIWRYLLIAFHAAGECRRQVKSLTKFVKNVEVM